MNVAQGALPNAALLSVDCWGYLQPPPDPSDPPDAEVGEAGGAMAVCRLLLGLLDSCEGGGKGGEIQSHASLLSRS